MKNHIEAKFLGFNYSPLPSDEFDKRISNLADSLRSIYPRFVIKPVRNLYVDLSNESVAAHQQDVGNQLHMVNADGILGIKIGNGGISISTSKYVSYEEIVSHLSDVLKICADVLDISFFSKAFLRNINLFSSVDKSETSFNDIRNNEYWGKQNFNTLSDKFLCSGASTRHEYFSNDYLKHIQLVSGIVLQEQNQSYIPQDQWDIWQLRGNIPIAKESQLLIDISGTAFQAPVNKPELQNNVTEYDWGQVKKSFDDLHIIINNVYSDITKD